MKKKASEVNKVREYQYFINSEGRLVMKPEKFKNTDVLLTCRLSVKESDNHEHGIHLY